MENEKKKEVEANVVAKNKRKYGNRRKKREANQERSGKKGGRKMRLNSLQRD